MRIYFRTSLAVATAVVIAGMASGCSSAADKVSQAVAEQAASRVVESFGGDDEDIDVSFGGSAELPDGWPGLPVPEGEILMSIAIDDSYSLQVLTTPESAEAALQEYKNLGFEVGTETNLAELSITALMRGNEHVNYSVVEEDGETIASILYMQDEDE